MKIIIAPDSFKESLSALQVAEEIEGGFREIFPQAQLLTFPLADGGEGTVEALTAATGGARVPVDVTGPLGGRIPSFYGVTGDRKTAVIEMAAASGLALVPPQRRNPMKTTSFGTGELIGHALDAGVRTLIIGIGGSATNDAGAGMLQALGVRLIGKDGREIGFGGEALGELQRIDADALDPRLKECAIHVACDVDNPLTGPRGASAVFAPQKGGTSGMVVQLEENLVRFARIVARDRHRQIAQAPGAGAAGGMGGALLAFLDASLKPGIEIVIKALALEEHMKGADLVVTGEGRLDDQTLGGKAPLGITRLAAKYGVPVIAVAGSLGADARLFYPQGMGAVFSVIDRPCSLDEALTRAADNLRRTARNIAAAVAMGGRLGAGTGPGSTHGREETGS